MISENSAKVKVMERHSEAKPVHVQIGEIDLSLKTDEDPIYVKQLAKYIDDIIQRISGGTNVKSQTKITLLAALQIADELFQARSGQESAEAALKNLQHRSETLAKELDEKLSKVTPIQK